MTTKSKVMDDLWDEMLGVSAEDTPAWTVKHALDQLRYLESQMPSWRFTTIESRPPSIEYIALLMMSLRMHSGTEGLQQQIVPHLLDGLDTLCYWLDKETRFAFYVDSVKNAVAHREIRKNVATIAFLFDYDPQKLRPALLACPTFVELLLYMWTPRDAYGEELYAWLDLANTENAYDEPCPFVALFRKITEDEPSRAALLHHIYLHHRKRGHKDLIWGVVCRIQLSVTVPEYKAVVSYKKLFLAQDLLSITCGLSTDNPWLKQKFIREPCWTLGWFSLILESNAFAALEKEGDKYNIIPSVDPAIKLYHWSMEEDNVKTVRNFKNLVKGKFLHLLMLIDCGFGTRETLAMWGTFGQYITHPGVVDILLEVWEDTARTGRPPDHIDLPEELNVFWKAVAYNYRVRVECQGEPLDLCDNRKCEGLWKPGCADSKQCSGCSTVIYCSDECQEMDWHGLHRAECSRARAQHSLRVANGTWYPHRTRFFQMVLIEWRYEEIVSNPSVYSWKFEQNLPSTPFSFVDALPILSFLDVKFEWYVRSVSSILDQSHRTDGNQPIDIVYGAQDAFFILRWKTFVEAYTKEARQNPKGVRLAMAHFALSKDWVVTLLVKLRRTRWKTFSERRWEIDDGSCIWRYGRRTVQPGEGDEKRKKKQK